MIRGGDDRRDGRGVERPRGRRPSRSRRGRGRKRQNLGRVGWTLRPTGRSRLRPRRTAAATWSFTPGTRSRRPRREGGRCERRGSVLPVTARSSSARTDSGPARRPRGPRSCSAREGCRGRGPPGTPAPVYRVDGGEHVLDLTLQGVVGAVAVADDPDRHRVAACRRVLRTRSPALPLLRSCRAHRSSTRSSARLLLCCESCGRFRTRSGP